MNQKNELMAAFIALVEAELKILSGAFEASRSAATHEESKQEDKHDTRGVEASYLAAGQANRVEELKRTLSILKNFSPRQFVSEDKIGLGALIELVTNNEPFYYFLSPVGGGYKVSLDKMIQIITPESLLGQELKDKYVGDEIEAKAKVRKIYQIKAIS